MNTGMPLSYHWSPHCLQVVCRGTLHMVPVDDSRHPWALSALSQSEQAVADVLAGNLPLGPEENKGTYTAQAIEQETQQWEDLGTMDDATQACMLACEYLLTHTASVQVRVLNEEKEEVYALDRHIALATSVD